MRNEQIDEIRTYLSSKYPQFELKEFLGEGNHGFVFAISENKALKFTIDDGEIEVCRCLEDHKLRYLCNIEKVGKRIELNVSWNNRSKEYTWIVLELLYKSPNQECVNQALQDFRRSWSDLYKFSNFSWSDLWSIYRKRELSKITLCKQHCVNYIRSACEQIAPWEELSKDQIDRRVSNALKFFDFIENAYRELFKVCSFGEIDLNAGNFMLDENNNLKVIDMQKVNL